MRKLWTKVERVVADGAITVILSGALLSSLSSKSYAAYGFLDAFETIGISTGIGTVLGLSTLPFYDSPPLSNVYIGAGIGLLVGLGTSAYLWSTSSDEIDEIGYEELIVPREKKEEGSKDKKANDKSKSGKGAYLLRSNSSVRTLARQVHSRTAKKDFLSKNLVSATLAQASADMLRFRSGWSVAVGVLELRF